MVNFVPTTKIKHNMKKIMLSAVALMAFGLSNAQEEASGSGFSRGDVFLSGSAGFSSTKTGDAEHNVFNIIPRAGYFVNSNIAVGLQAGYSKDATTDVGPVTGQLLDTDITTVEIGAFGRYYFTPASDFSLFVDLSVSYGTVNREQDAATGPGPGDIVTVEDEFNGFFAGFAPGVNYFISDHFALEATFGVLNYSTIKPDADGAESTDNFDIGINMSDINLGLIYKF